MKVINKTVWRTDHLKAILQRCARQEFDDGSRRKRLVITIEYTRKGGCSGYAWYHSNHSVVRIANPNGTITRRRSVPLDDPRKAIRRYGKELAGNTVKAVRESVPVIQDMTRLKLLFASVACHEFAHNRGMKHRGMPKHYKWASGSWKSYVAWAAEMPLEQKPSVAKPTASETISQKLVHVRRMQRRASTRLRRARTIDRKWAAKVKYYERRSEAAAMTTMKEERPR
jgi:hypothetical protein